MRRRDGVLIIVQNLSVPRDRRVWLECQALVAAGRRVSVICPQGEGEARVEDLDGVRIHRYPSPPATTGAASFVWEFAYCWLRTLVLAARIWLRRPFEAIQACNPPDTYWLLALLFRPLGVRFVYDQHDLCPELYESRFANPSAALHRALLLLERCTYRSADHVIATNETYRSRAIGRGKVDPDRVTVVRNGPRTDRLRPGPEVPELRRGRRHLACYVGVMGPQDGVELIVHAAAHYVRVLGRDDCSFALLGSGDCHHDLVELVASLGLDDVVSLPGWADDAELTAYLSTASVGLSPDPMSSFNDASTMNKTMEYMAFGLPVVAFDLRETRISAQDAAMYVPPNDTDKFARTIADLLDDDALRARMRSAGRERAVTELDWRHQVPGYVALYEGLLDS